MVRTLLLYDGKMGSAERVVSRLSCLIGNAKVADLKEAPNDLRPYGGLCIAFSFYGPMSAVNVKKYLMLHKEELKSFRVVLVGMGFGDFGFMKYVQELEAEIGVLKIEPIFLANESDSARVGTEISRFLHTPERPMDKDELKEVIDSFIQEHHTMALATGSTDGVRCTPVSYIYMGGAFYIVTEGGVKFRGILENGNVSGAVYDNDTNRSTARGLQFSGKAEIVPRGSMEYYDILAENSYSRKIVDSMPVTMFVVRIEPMRFEYLDHSLLGKNYDSHQVCDTEYLMMDRRAGERYADRVRHASYTNEEYAKVLQKKLDESGIQKIVTEEPEEIEEEPVEAPKTEVEEIVEEAVEASAAEVEEPVEEPAEAPAVEVEETVEEPIEAPAAEVEEIVEEPVEAPAAEVEEIVEEPVEAPAAEVEETVEETEKASAVEVEEIVEEPVEAPAAEVEEIVEETVEAPKTAAEKPVEESAKVPEAEKEETAPEAEKIERIDTPGLHEITWTADDEKLTDDTLAEEIMRQAQMSLAEEVAEVKEEDELEQEATAEDNETEVKADVKLSENGESGETAKSGSTPSWNGSFEEKERTANEFGKMFDAKAAEPIPFRMPEFKSAFSSKEGEAGTAYTAPASPLPQIDMSVIEGLGVYESERDKGHHRFEYAAEAGESKTASKEHFSEEDEIYESEKEAEETASSGDPAVKKQKKHETKAKHKPEIVRMEPEEDLADEEDFEAGESEAYKVPSEEPKKKAKGKKNNVFSKFGRALGKMLLIAPETSEEDEDDGLDEILNEDLNEDLPETGESVEMEEEDSAEESSADYQEDEKETVRTEASKSSKSGSAARKVRNHAKKTGFLDHLDDEPDEIDDDEESLRSDGKSEKRFDDDADDDFEDDFDSDDERGSKDRYDDEFDNDYGRGSKERDRDDLEDDYDDDFEEDYGRDSKGHYDDDFEEDYDRGSNGRYDDDFDDGYDEEPEERSERRARKSSGKSRGSSKKSGGRGPLSIFGDRKTAKKSGKTTSGRSERLEKNHGSGTSDSSKKRSHRYDEMEDDPLEDLHDLYGYEDDHRGSSGSSYDDGYRGSYDDGYHGSGYDDGYSSYDDGYNDSYRGSYDDGYNDSYRGSYDGGYNDGYDDGYRGSYDGGYNDGYDDGYRGSYDDGYDNYDDRDYNGYDDYDERSSRSKRTSSGRSRAKKRRR